jgi:hypothetical protein
MFDDLPTDPTNKNRQFTGAVDRISPADGIQGWALDTQDPVPALSFGYGAADYSDQHSYGPAAAGHLRRDQARIKIGFIVSWQSFDSAYVQQLLSDGSRPVHILA